MTSMSCGFKSVVAALLLLPCALFLEANPLPAETFSYSGFGLQMDLSILREKYPKSSHEFWPHDGSPVFFASDNPRRFDDLVRVGTGRYLIRLTADESHNDLRYVQAEIGRGVIRRLMLSFENPSGSTNRQAKSGFEERPPRCDGIKAGLIRMYGKPSSTLSS
jgi:hypothetical protein